MGGEPSKPSPPPEPPKPWRILQGDQKSHLDFLRNYKPRNSKAKHVRILLHGPIGAGKSSFINSVDSILQDRITTRALADALSARSFTRKYTSYNIYKDAQDLCCFVFNDTMGLEQNREDGIHVEDLKLVLKGHVKEGTKFSAETQIKEGDPGYNPSPTLDDRVHVLVSVVPMNVISILQDGVVTKMREVRQAASEAGIPQLVVITKVDHVSSQIKQDVKEAFKNKQIENQVNVLSETLGMPPNCIFLVQNYHSETYLKPDMNALILDAMKRIVEVGDDYLKDQRED